MPDKGPAYQSSSAHRFAHSRYTGRISAAVLPDIAARVNTLAEQSQVPVAEIIRECLDVGLPIISKRRRDWRARRSTADPKESD